MSEKPLKSPKDLLAAMTWSPYHKKSYQEAVINKEDGRKIIFTKEINDKKDKENEYVGSQGQILTKYGRDLYVGSGMLFVQIHPEESNRKIVLTCGHNFIKNNNENTQYFKADYSEFYFRISKDENNDISFDDWSELKWHVFDKYEENPLLNDNFYNDFAIAFCKNDFNDFTKTRKNIYIWTLEEAEVEGGEGICVAGYPHINSDDKYNHHLRYCTGTIKEIRYKDSNSKEEAVILYDNLDTSGGQSGSPVYLKRNDGTWVIIGVHIGWFEENGKIINRAVGITRKKKDWIIEKLTAI